MRCRQWLIMVPVLLLAAGLLSVACGGSGDDRRPPDLSKIPTATPPDPLPEVIIVGEVSPPVQGETYIVKAGDSPASIADQFGTTAQAIIEANDIANPTMLEVGRVLTIPGSAGIEEVLGVTVEPPATPEPEGPTIYVVRSGDIPETIAAQFGIMAEELMAANGITDPTSLYIGQELVIPSPAPTATPE